MFGKLRSAVALVTAVVFAVSLVVTPPRAQADGGKGSDSLQLIAPALAPLAFIALSLGNSPLSKRFRAVATILTVMLLLSGPTMMPLYLQALSRFSRADPLLGRALQYSLVYSILTAMTFQFLLQNPAQAKAGRPLGYLSLQNYFAWTPPPTLPDSIRLSDTVAAGIEHFEAPDGAASLNRDAAAGDPTAKAVQRLLPYLTPSIKRGYGWVDYGITPARSAAGLFALPSYFLNSDDFVYDRKFWDRAMFEALDAMECDDCLWDLEEDADWGDPSAIAALMIFDELVRRRHRIRLHGRIGTRLLADPLIELRSDEIIRRNGVNLRRLRFRINTAFTQREEDNKVLWSKPLNAPKRIFAGTDLMPPAYLTYTGFRAGGTDWPELAGQKGARNQVDRPALTFNLKYNF